MLPDWTFDPNKDANDMTAEQLKAQLDTSLADLKAGVHRSQKIEEDESDEDTESDEESDEPVPGWFKLAASLVLFSPFIAGILYGALR